MVAVDDRPRPPDQVTVAQQPAANPTALARLALAASWVAACWSLAALLLIGSNIRTPHPAFDLLRRGNIAAWMVASIFGAGAALAIALWAVDDRRQRYPPDWVWLVAAVALLWLSADAVAALHTRELPRLLNGWLSEIHPLAGRTIDGDEAPPVATPLIGLVALALGACVARLRGVRPALLCGAVALMVLATAAGLELRRLLAYADNGRPSQNLAVAIDAARLIGGCLLLWAMALRLRLVARTAAHPVR